MGGGGGELDSHTVTLTDDVGQRKCHHQRDQAVRGSVTTKEARLVEEVPPSKGQGWRRKCHHQRGQAGRRSVTTKGSVTTKEASLVEEVSPLKRPGW